MALSPGVQLGPYEVIGPLGAGGMGQVYRGLDTRLSRPVAIKQAHEAFSDRFKTEARAIAALNHPNICTLYDVGPDYLVMEFIDGETLADRLARTAPPPDEILRIGVAIADALAAAHAKGLTHRDLKPANVMVTRTGVKVLDFGLAKFTGATADTALATQGVVGTPAYMAPEQVKGRGADARTDIFALGLVLAEMATGRRSLVGHGQAVTLDGVPERLAHIIERCLAFEPDDRWQSAGDVRRELEWAAKPPAVTPARVAQGAARRVAIGLLVATAFAAAIASPWWSRARGDAASGPVIRTTIGLPEGWRLLSASRMAMAPDGNTLAFVAVRNLETGLFVRALDSAEARLVPGTAGALHPFFSPDGAWIAFFAQGALQRVSLSGGAPLRIATVSGGSLGGAWGADDTIVFTATGRLHRVRVSGGEPEEVPDAGAAYFPEFLADGTTVLFTTTSAPFLAGGQAFAVVPATGGGRRVIAALSDSAVEGPRALGTGGTLLQANLRGRYLVYGQSPGFVRALPMDPDSLTPTGPPIPIADAVERGANSGPMAFAVSSAGVIVFGGTGERHQLVWVDRTGTATPLAPDLAAFRTPRLSPDGRTVAVSINDETRRSDIWIYDAERGTRTRLTSAAHNLAPVWTPDGTRITFAGGGIAERAPDGGPESVFVPYDVTHQLLPTGTNPYPTSWSADGAMLFQADAREVWLVTRAAGRPVRLIPNAWGAMFSPDGRAVAYVSDEAGRLEVYVARFPTLDGKTVVSAGGGTTPRWSRDGREIFYRRGDAVMAARVDQAGSAGFRVAPPQQLFSGAYSGAAQNDGFDVSLDGRRFVMVKSDPSAELRELTVVQNWPRAWAPAAPAP